MVRTIALHLVSWLLRCPPAEDSCYDRAGGNTAGDRGVEVGGGDG
ncbi:hypothetical protein [Microcoleus sp. herbarium12]